MKSAIAIVCFFAVSLPTCDADAFCWWRRNIYMIQPAPNDDGHQELQDKLIIELLRQVGELRNGEGGPGQLIQLPIQPQPPTDNLDAQLLRDLIREHLGHATDNCQPQEPIVIQPQNVVRPQKVRVRPVRNLIYQWRR